MVERVLSSLLNSSLAPWRDTISTTAAEFKVSMIRSAIGVRIISAILGLKRLGSTKTKQSTAKPKRLKKLCGKASDGIEQDFDRAVKTMVPLDHYGFIL